MLKLGIFAAGVIRLRSGVADGAAVEVEFVDQFFTDEDLHTSRRCIGWRRVVAGKHAGIIGGRRAIDRVAVEGDFEGSRVVGGSVFGDAEVDVARDVIAGGEGSGEVGLQWSRVGWGFGGGACFRRCFCGGFGGGKVESGVLNKCLCEWV